MDPQTFLLEQIRHLQEEIRNERQTKETTNAIINNLQDQITTLRSTIQPAAPARPKLPLPPVFTGSETDLDAELSNWAFMSKHYLNAVDLERDTAGVYVIASRLQGHAASWYRSQCTTHNRNYRDPLALINDLVDAFKPTNAVDQARDALAELTQTTSVQDYTRKFKVLLLAIPNINEAEILDKYKRGLQANIRQQVKLQKCHDLETMVAVALSVENVTSSRTRFHLPKSEVNQQVSMDIDAVTALGIKNLQKPPFKKLSQDEKDILAKHHGCFRCRRVFVDHSAYNCPEKPATDHPVFSVDVSTVEHDIESYSTGSTASNHDYSSDYSSD